MADIIVYDRHCLRGPLNGSPFLDNRLNLAARFDLIFCVISLFFIMPLFAKTAPFQTKVFGEIDFKDPFLSETFF